MHAQCQLAGHRQQGRRTAMQFTARLLLRVRRLLDLPMAIASDAQALDVTAREEAATAHLPIRLTGLAEQESERVVEVKETRERQHVNSIASRSPLEAMSTLTCLQSRDHGHWIVGSATCMKHAWPWRQNGRASSAMSMSGAWLRREYREIMSDVAS